MDPSRPPGSRLARMATSTARRSSGGTNSQGTLFRISPGGAHEVLHHFAIASGGVPDGRLIEPEPGEFIGTTQLGGTAAGGGVVFRRRPVTAVMALDKRTVAGVRGGDVWNDPRVRKNVAADCTADAKRQRPGRVDGDDESALAAGEPGVWHRVSECFDRHRLQPELCRCLAA